MTLVKRPPPLFPQVAVDPWTEPFWAAAREHRLVVPQCSACGVLRMPPGPFCPACHSQSVNWRVLPGTGAIYSYTIVMRAIVPEMEGHLPYVPAVVSLDGADDIRLISAIIECEMEQVAVGVPVRLLWRAAPGGQELPFFTIAGTAA